MQQDVSIFKKKKDLLTYSMSVKDKNIHFLF